MTPLAHYVRACLRLHVEIQAGRAHGLVAMDARQDTCLDYGGWPQLSEEERALARRLFEALGLRELSLKEAS